MVVIVAGSPADAATPASHSSAQKQEQQTMTERIPAVMRSVAETPSAEDAAAREITAVYFVVTPNREQLVELAGLVDGGELRPTVDRVFPLANARAAFQLSLGDHQPGKIVLRVADEQDGGSRS
jgi:NADPH:quinone reductase-like Zn-dependent oxidoreductase